MAWQHISSEVTEEF